MTLFRPMAVLPDCSDLCSDCSDLCSDCSDRVRTYLERVMNCREKGEIRDKIKKKRENYMENFYLKVFYFYFIFAVFHLFTYFNL